MKVKISQPVYVEAVVVHIDVPVCYGEEDIPKDFPHRSADPEGGEDRWRATVEVDTGKILDWPQNVGPMRMHMKVNDAGSYELADGTDTIVGEVIEDYVPHGLIPGEYGDYIILDIDANGVITNWPKRPKLDKFFQKED